MNAPCRNETLLRTGTRHRHRRSRSAWSCSAGVLNANFQVPVAEFHRSVKMMRALLMLFLLALCSCGPKDQARTPAKDPLEEAKHLAEQGRYQEALEKHVWLHDHVLENRPGYY